MRKPLQKHLNGKTYTVHPLDPEQALAVMAKAAALGLPALGKGLASFKGQSLANVMDQQVGDIFKKLNLESVLTTLAEHMDDEKVVSIVQTLMKGVEEGSAVIDWKREFTGDLQGLFKLLWVALEVNFGDFFGEKPDVGK